MCWYLPAMPSLTLIQSSMQTVVWGHSEGEPIETSPIQNPVAEATFFQNIGEGDVSPAHLYLSSVDGGPGMWETYCQSFTWWPRLKTSSSYFTGKKLMTKL